MPDDYLYDRQVEELLDDRIPRPDWKDSNARRGQIVAVTKKTLSAEPRNLSELSKVRNEKQKEVAKNMNLRTRTVMDKCGRQLYKGSSTVPENKYHQKFDKMLWEIHKVVRE